ncbi:hypothetical protein Tco_0031829 [Tanacetum coccineum]
MGGELVNRRLYKMERRIVILIGNPVHDKKDNKNNYGLLMAYCSKFFQGFRITEDYPHRALKNKGIVDSGCSRHMTRNKAHLAEYQDYNGGPVAFGEE